MIIITGSDLKEILETINSFQKGHSHKFSNRGRKRRSTAIATDLTFRKDISTEQERRNEASTFKIGKKLRGNKKLVKVTTNRGRQKND